MNETCFAEAVCIEMEKQKVSVATLATWADVPCLVMLQIVDGKRAPRRNEIRDIKKYLKM